MSELGIPESWTLTKLFNACRNIRGVTYKKQEASGTEQKSMIAILRANNIDNGVINYKSLVYIPLKQVREEQILKKGDIIIAMSSGSIKVVGKAAQFDDFKKVSFGAFCGVIRLNIDECKDIGFWGWFFQSARYRSYISSVARGANIKNLLKSHLENITLPIPPL
ncbi:MAG: restriction endonuclease subunit S, partial [Bacteriovoracales bacterium]|nr:restriction endonuclease subunit S [Bacteriovoracales bacterium]